jgi:hypothetical protein
MIHPENLYLRLKYKYRNFKCCEKLQYEVNNAPYIVWTRTEGDTVIAPLAINANGTITYDPAREFLLYPARNSSPPAVFQFNNSNYIVWTDGGDFGTNINIAPIAINTNGVISYDASRKLVFPGVNGNAISPRESVIPATIVASFI